MKRFGCIPTAFALAMVLGPGMIFPNAAPIPATNSLKTLPVRLSWGHQSTNRLGAFYLALHTNDLVVTDLQTFDFESDDRHTLSPPVWRSTAGAGDVDGVAFSLAYPERAIGVITNVQQIWNHLLAHSDSNTVRHIKADPAYRPDSRKLTVQLNENGTRGFSLTVDQLLTHRAFWVPELDVFVAIGDPPVSFAEQQRALAPARGQRVLDQVASSPEATYADFTARWEDMGSPAYQNPHSVGPGHIVGITWDSAIPKFGIDRGGNVWNDYGNPDRFFLGWDLGDLRRLKPTSSQAATASSRATTLWRGQKLVDGLPVLKSTFERAGVLFELEHFAYPLDGLPRERRGDLAMVLFAKLTLRELMGKPQSVPLRWIHRRELSTNHTLIIRTNQGRIDWLRAPDDQCLLSLEGDGFEVQSNALARAKWVTNEFTLRFELPANGTRDYILKLPSPGVPLSDVPRFHALQYNQARSEAVRFWSNYLAQGAQFEVPEEAVNTLFRASLWHALRLPRRHGGTGPAVKIDLPYSNFAYDQRGTPWPVNQAIYVDYMLYDLRGYHAISAEELAAMFRNNQGPNGHVGGFANWGVYTPSLIYAVAQNFLLSGDRATFDALLEPTLKALDWCLGEIRKANTRTGPAPGLVLAPLNDLSHDPRAWAFNQAYLFAGPNLLAKALAQIQHPRAAECRAVSEQLQRDVQRAFGRASMESPLVQLRDETWIPYVPGDALTPRRLLEVWYPTDVDTGPLHLSRLKVLDPKGELTTFLLHDHEDNLFYRQWGMANEPVYNQHATALWLRDEPQAVVRAFYSMLACAFSHSVFEPVEHRWGWGQYFGPPSTDGAWFELYRNMLIQEREDGALVLCQATPRPWLTQGKRIRVERAPTYYGRLNFTIESRVGDSEIRVRIDVPRRQRPGALQVRLRHPEHRPMQSATVNAQPWSDFNPAQEWIRIVEPKEDRYEIVARY